MKDIQALPPLHDGHFMLKGCQVSAKPLPVDPPLSSQQMRQYHQMMELINSHPKKARKEIEKQFDQCLTHPTILNLRTFCEIRLKKAKKANQLIELNYHSNPHSVLATMNYGDMLLRQKRMKTFESIFGSSQDIGDLFPGHTLFYYEDARAYYTLMGFYWLKKKDKRKARLYYSNAYKLNTKHPSVEVLESQLMDKKSITQRLKLLWGAGKRHLLRCK